MAYKVVMDPTRKNYRVPNSTVSVRQQRELELCDSGRLSMR